MPLFLNIFLTFVFFPPVGMIMMLISCSSRDYAATDVLLALFVPLYGHVMFWTCP